MNERKISFILCGNDEFVERECQVYIEQLIVPDGYEVEVLVIHGAISMAGGYQEAMLNSDAKYKVYLRPDILIINPCFIQDMLTLFQKYSEIGMLGMVGHEIWSDGGDVREDGNVSRVGGIMEDYILGNQYVSGKEVKGEYVEVIGLEGMILATQYDLDWREDLFDGWDFYDYSQSIEFWKAGYSVVVPHVEAPWCICASDVPNKVDYQQWQKIFWDGYGIFIQEWMRRKYPVLGDEINREKVERIGYPLCDLRRYEIKPEFNTTWYKGVDQYSEGEIEDHIIQLILANESDDYTDAILRECNWSVYYHLTDMRENLLNWYPFDREASVLEIGCGMGAVTNMLCDRCRKVTAVELSKKRATATVLRCREKDNLEVIVGNLTDIEFQEQYDYITLIGVLEYQGNYSDSQNPYIEFLKKIKGFLKPNGKLLIAIENKYGLKYWCGAKEDHTGVPFDGINQYALGNQGGRTFSKEELTDFIRKSGFEGSYFYYPLPDYKLPQVVYSEQYLPQTGELADLSYYYIPDTESLFIDERGVYDDLVKNHVFEFFSNSFLVECSVSPEEELGQIVFAKASRFRNSDYKLGTRIWRRESQRVEKFPLTKNEKIRELLVQTHNNTEGLSDRGLSVAPSFLQAEDSLLSEYIEGSVLLEKLRESYLQGDREQIWNWYDRWWEELVRSSEEGSPAESMIVKWGLGSEQDAGTCGVILKTGNIDMVPRNCIVRGDEMIWFDQEWSFEGVPAKFILYRGIVLFYTEELKEAEDLIKIRDVLMRYRINEDVLRIFEQLEDCFANLVINFKKKALNQGLSKSGIEVIKQNAAKLSS